MKKQNYEAIGFIKDTVSGKEMKYILSIILLIFSAKSIAYDSSVAVGQWSVYQNELLSGDRYYFLNINEDFSGVLIRSLGHKPIVREFQSSAVKKHDGFFEVILSQNEKAVFSAWKLKSGNGKLTGQIFMYKENGDLFNMLYFPLELLNETHELMKQDEIKALSNKYR